MHKISAAQFKAAVELDPAWASKLTEPVEITDYCDMRESEITHLSPLLHFTGRDEDGDSANFNFCKSLKVAEGNFEGWVGFSWSGIEKIKNLICGKGNKGSSTSFFGCKSLKIAEGKFAGSSNFSGSGVEKIGDLSCGKNNYGIRLGIKDCPNLKSIPITFTPEEIEADSELIKNLTEVRRFIQKKRAEIVEVEI